VIVQIDPADDRPIYQQIVDEVRRARVVGALCADEPLPSVRQMAVTLRVNPNTVAQAYRELEREGVVYVRRGQGTFATSTTAGAAERTRLAMAVAERALRDAHRHDLDADSLIRAIRELDGHPSGENS
jgi:GntR family transcriptional regulator